MPDVCNPAHHPTWEQLKDHCEDKHEAQEKWANAVIKQSEDDRKNLWSEVTELKKIPGKMQAWFIGILVTIILASYIMPRLARNGDSQHIRELATKVSIIVDKQASFDSILNDVREDQIKRQKTEKK